MRTLALTVDGDLTYCSVDETVRGTKGCNHIGHAGSGQTTKDFIAEMENKQSFTPQEALAVYSMKQKREQIADQLELSFSPKTSENNDHKHEVVTNISDLDDGGVIMKLSSPVMNDSSKAYYSQQWGLKKSNLTSIMAGESGMVYRVGVEGTNYRIGQPLTSDEITHLRESYTQQEIAVAVGGQEFSEACAHWNVESPSDEVYVLTNDERRSSNEYPNDIHQLYRRLYRASAAHEKNPSAKTAAQVQLAYDQLLDNENIEEPFRIKGNKLRGISSLVNGKSGLLRHEITGGVVRHSGRAVITPDEELDYNEARLPMKLAVTMYEPLLRDRLMNERGMSREEVARYLAHLRWANYEQISDEDKEFVSKTLEESDLRCLLGRQPSLHRASLQAFKPSLSPDNTIKISPSVVKGFNADFDGDTMMAIAINDVDISQNALSSAHAENLTQQPSHRETSLVLPSKDARLGVVASFSGYRCSSNHVSHRGMYGNLIGTKDDGSTELCGESYTKAEAEEIMDYSMPVHDEATGRVVSYGQLKAEEITNQYMSQSDDDPRTTEFLNKIAPEDLDKLNKLGFEMAPFFSQEIHEKKMMNDHGEYHNSIEHQWVAQGVAGNSTAAQHINEAIGEIMTSRGEQNIDANYRDGLSREQLFDKSFTSRRAAVAKTVNVARPGYTARKLFYGLSAVTKADNNCGAGDILKCKNSGSICADCSKGLGNSDDRYIGGIVSTNLSEPGTQLSMREFHSGGVGNTDASSVLNATYDAWSNSPIIKDAATKGTTDERRKAIFDGLKAEYASHGVKMDDDNIKLVARQMTSFTRTKQGLQPVKDGEVADIVSLKAIGSSSNPLKSAAMEAAYRRLSSKGENFTMDNSDSANFMLSL